MSLGRCDRFAALALPELQIRAAGGDFPFRPHFRHDAAAARVRAGEAAVVLAANQRRPFGATWRETKPVRFSRGIRRPVASAADATASPPPPRGSSSEVAARRNRLDFGHRRKCANSRDSGHVAEIVPFFGTRLRGDGETPGGIGRRADFRVFPRYFSRGEILLPISREREDALFRGEKCPLSFAGNRVDFCHPAGRFIACNGRTVR